MANTLQVVHDEPVPYVRCPSCDSRLDLPSLVGSQWSVRSPRHCRQTPDRDGRSGARAAPCRDPQHQEPRPTRCHRIRGQGQRIGRPCRRAVPGRRPPRRRRRGTRFDRRDVDVKRGDRRRIDAYWNEASPRHQLPNDRAQIAAVHRPRPVGSAAEYGIPRDIPDRTFGPGYSHKVGNGARVDPAIRARRRHRAFRSGDGVQGTTREQDHEARGQSEKPRAMDHSVRLYAPRFSQRR